MMRFDPSLRLGLLLRLSAVLVLLLAVDAIANYVTALHFANEVYDRWLIDSVRSLSRAVHVADGRVEFDLPRVALEVFQFDEVDQTFFKIASRERGYIAGDRALPDMPNVGIGTTKLADIDINHQRVRLVSSRISVDSSDDPVMVSVAETLKKRSALAQEILPAMVAPQIALLGIALLLAWLGVSRGLKPLTDLATEIETRDHANLSPVSEANLPREARVLAARINELFGRVGAAMRAQKRFVADAAHQLRTPLASLVLHAERAERASDLESAKQALKGIHRSVERATRLGQQLITLARTDPEDLAATARFRPVDLALLAREVGEEWIPRSIERDIDFGLAVPDQPVLISGDQQLLGEMLSNLIDNAIRYGRDGGRVTVSVTAGAQPKLSVEDDGPGIPEAARQQVFQRFYRMPSTDTEGCGLGLAIVQEIAAVHNAAIELTTGPQSTGACITLAFPRSETT